MKSATRARADCVIEFIWEGFGLGSPKVFVVQQNCCKIGYVCFLMRLSKPQPMMRKTLGSTYISAGLNKLV